MTGEHNWPHFDGIENGPQKGLGSITGRTSNEWEWASKMIGYKYWPQLRYGGWKKWVLKWTSEWAWKCISAARCCISAHWHAWAQCLTKVMSPPASLASIIGRKAILVCQLCRKTSRVPDDNRCEAAIPLTNRLGFQEIELPTNFRWLEEDSNNMSLTHPTNEHMISSPVQLLKPCVWKLVYLSSRHFIMLSLDRKRSIEDKELWTWGKNLKNLNLEPVVRNLHMHDIV